jgi:hypothetical protein
VDLAQLRYRQSVVGIEDGGAWPTDDFAGGRQDHLQTRPKGRLVIDSETAGVDLYGYPAANVDSEDSLGRDNLYSAGQKE